MRILRFKYQRFTSLVNRLKCLRGNPNRVRFLASKYLKIPFRPVLEHNFPPMVIVETTNECNLACTHCPRREVIKDPEYKIGFMNMDLYKKIVDEISQYKYATLRPFGDGEPLLHPQIVEMIHYAKEKGITKIWLNTNGLLLDEKISRALLKAGLDLMEVSIDAATEETYRKIRIGSNFNLVIQNVIRYAELKRQILPQAKVEVSFVESTDNIQEEAEFIRFWKRRVDTVGIRPFHQHAGLVKENKRARKYFTERRCPCPTLWKRIMINFDGRVKFCGLDSKNQGVIGNIPNQTIKEIWNGETYTKFRRLHIQGKFDEIPICGKCTDYFQHPW